MDDIQFNVENHSLFVRTAAGVIEPATAQQILAVALSIIGQHVKRGTTLQTPQLVRDYVRLKLGRLEHEVFAMLLLDNRHCLLDYEELFRGTIDGCTIHTREVVKIALARNAAAVIFVHNHPSGAPEPSVSDMRTTEKLRSALALIEIRVLDHLVVGGEEVVSFSERGLL